MKVPRTTSNAASVMIILSDHDQRVLFRKMAEERFDLTVLSVADPLQGLTLLQKVAPPGFLLLSSRGFPIMNHIEFLERKSGIPEIVRIPVVLLSRTAGPALHRGVAEEVVEPLGTQEFAALVKRYCSG